MSRWHVPLGPSLLPLSRQTRKQPGVVAFQGEAADKLGALGAAADGGKGAAGGAGEIVGPIKLPGGQGGAVGAGEIDGRLMLPWAAGGHGGADSAGEIVGRFTPPGTAGHNGCGDITRAQPCSLEFYWTASGDGGDDGWAPWPSAGALEVSDGRPELPAPPMGLRPQPESETQNSCLLLCSLKITGRGPKDLKKCSLKITGRGPEDLKTRSNSQGGAPRTPPQNRPP